ncbi:gpi anchored serine-threonine rich protein [Rutstroemia sp. NJR-2017a BVV2]|nr:gpi anchored serine-threonine rich protein [Rutstroemia sp. NJR-2017a BVV2]
MAATLLISLAAAQSSAAVAPGTSVCAGQNVLDACLGSTRAIANACQTNDYNCLCSKWNDVLTCFESAGCPNDPQYAGTLSNKQTYCANASVYSSSSSSAISKDWPTSATTTAATATGSESAAAASKTSGTGSASKTGTASATSATGSSGAEKAVVGAGGVLGLVAGVVAWLL